MVMWKVMVFNDEVEAYMKKQKITSNQPQPYTCPLQLFQPSFCASVQYDHLVPCSSRDTSHPPQSMLFLPEIVTALPPIITPLNS
ncbi:hypothetical protein VNO77_41341 [Canavalia gladiata]|uniref:Uncharacterized protein n=1 Tax=Canavalia gladiata TaxID=3824 RepID=A0AAN9K118_CANGL